MSAIGMEYIKTELVSRGILENGCNNSDVIELIETGITISSFDGGYLLEDVSESINLVTSNRDDIVNYVLDIYAYRL